MLHAKRNPRRETLRLSTERTASERSSMRCPSPAGEDSAASRAMPVSGAPQGWGGNRERIGKRSRVGFRAAAIFAICSPLGPAYSGCLRLATTSWCDVRGGAAGRPWAAVKSPDAKEDLGGHREEAKASSGWQRMRE